MYYLKLAKLNYYFIVDIYCVLIYDDAHLYLIFTKQQNTVSRIFNIYFNKNCNSLPKKLNNLIQGSTYYVVLTGINKKYSVKINF